MTVTASRAAPLRFHNTLFRVELGRTRAGSVRLHVFATNPGGRFDNRRQLAACIYELAAEFERRSEDFNVRWVISPEAFNDRLDLELCEGDDVEAVTCLVERVLTELGFGPIARRA